MTEVERHGLELRNRAYAELGRIASLRIVGPPPGPLATAIIACVLPDEIDSMTFRDTLLNKHGIVVKMIEKRRFNGFRLSPHIINTPADIGAALKAIRAEVGP